MILFIHTSGLFSFLHPWIFSHGLSQQCAREPQTHRQLLHTGSLNMFYRHTWYIIYINLCWGTKRKLVLQLLAVFGSSCEVASQPDRLRSNQIIFQIASLSSKGQDYSDADSNNNTAINTIYMNIYPKYTSLFFFSLQSLSYYHILFMCNSGVHSDIEGVCTVCSGQIPPHPLCPTPPCQMPHH